MPFKSEDVAWAAGLYEGEGTVRLDRFYWNRNSERCERATPQLKLRVGMTNREPLDRLVDIFGGAVMGPYQDRDHLYKPYWLWDLSSPPLVKEAIEAMWPWLSPKRRLQLEEVMPHAISQ